MLCLSVGRGAWESVVKVYAAQLESKGEPHFAALHWLSLGDIRSALQVYTKAGLLQDALMLASARLPAGDPQLVELHSLFGDTLLGVGHAERAAAQYIACKKWVAAVQALRSRGSRAAVQSALALAQRLLENDGGAISLSLEQIAELELIQQQLNQEIGLIPDSSPSVQAPDQHQVPTGRNISAIQILSGSGSVQHTEHAHEQGPPPPPPLNTYPAPSVSCTSSQGDLGTGQRKSYSRETMLALQSKAAEWMPADVEALLPDTLKRP